MKPCLTGGLRHRDVAVVGQARDHRVHRMSGEVAGERCGVARIESDSSEVRGPVRACDTLGSCTVDICQLHLVTAGFG